MAPLKLKGRVHADEARAAEAYARLGQPDSAIATMELLLRPTRMPGSAFALRGLAFPFAHRRLALWYAALGRRQQAAS